MNVNEKPDSTMPRFAPYKSTQNLPKIQIHAPMKDDRRYDALRNIDEHSDSSTEIDEEHWEQEHEGMRPRRRKSIWANAKRWRWVVDTALLLVIFGLLVEKRWKKHARYKKHKYEFAGDLTGFAPRFSQQIVSFTPNETFAPPSASAFFEPETLQAWLSIVPEGLGYLEIKDPSKHDDLPHPIHDYPGKTVFTTSMTHQLHCLYTILEAYNVLTLTAQSPVSFPPSQSPIKMPWHINHCFEYIRQAIMCAGDVALEGAATTFPPGDNGEDMGGSDGWDAKHVCKDYGEIYKYLERETVDPGNKWISSD